MIIYLAGTEQCQSHIMEQILDTGLKTNMLGSFYSVRPGITKNIPRFDRFILDSGAFSFIQNSKHVDWNEYVRRYIDYIKATSTKLFFELDIDALIGYDRVKEIRRRIEREVGIQPIPVWHKRLGRAEFLRMCDEYSCVAIGGIVSREIKKDEYEYFPWFITEAHKRGAKIHGLGFTNLEGLTKYHFDSVDSTAWTSGTRFGVAYRFNGRNLERRYVYELWKGKRFKDEGIRVHNFIEWSKFCAWAEVHL